MRSLKEGGQELIRKNKRERDQEWISYLSDVTSAYKKEGMKMKFYVQDMYSIARNFGRQGWTRSSMS
jgi:hypothetical protein